MTGYVDRPPLPGEGMTTLLMVRQQHTARHNITQTAHDALPWRNGVLCWTNRKRCRVKAALAAIRGSHETKKGRPTGRHLCLGVIRSTL